MVLVYISEHMGGRQRMFMLYVTGVYYGYFHEEWIGVVKYSHKQVEQGEM
jgi:hypothetical protein